MQGIWGAVRDPGSYQALHHFIAISQWDSNDVWRIIRSQIPEKRGVLIVDDTGFPKQGKHSVGVQRQYSGTLGRVGNCQVAVSTVLRSAHTTWPIDIELYLPEVWTEDADRRESAAIPVALAFRPKWEIALGQIAKARHAKVQIECVAADSGYGECTEFRDRLDRMHLRYIVGITSQTTVFAGEPRYQPRKPKGGRGRPRKYDPLSRSSPRPQTVKELGESLPRSAWKKVTWRRGTKGPLYADFAAIRIVPAHRWQQRSPRKSEWLLCERLRDGSRKYYLSNLPDDTSLKRMVDLAHTRWAVEQNYQQLKEELGLDHFEGRSWPGWHHHVVLTALTFAFLELERWNSKSKPLPTLPAMRRLVAELLFFHIVEERPDLQEIWAGRIAAKRSRAPP